jgi:small subunit ribosomal protein S3
LGNKTHPVGFRLGVIKPWQSVWFASKGPAYAKILRQDIAIRSAISRNFQDASIARVEIERNSVDLTVSIHTARPGVVIGKGGQRVEDLKGLLEKVGGQKPKINVQEIRQPELAASLVARSIAEQIERRIAFRRAMRQSMNRTMMSGAQGIKVLASGRLGGAEIARKERAMEGRVPLHTLRADIDYGFAEARTAMGRIGIKVWIFKGEILPDLVVEEEELAPIQVTIKGDSGESPSSSEVLSDDDQSGREEELKKIAQALGGSLTVSAEEETNGKAKAKAEEEETISVEENPDAST